MESEGKLSRGWLAVLRGPTPEEEVRIDQIIDAMLTDKLGRPPRVSSERVRLVNAQKGRDEIYAREDVQTVGRALTKEIDEEKLSVTALTVWRRHLFDNYYGVSPEHDLLKGLPPVAWDDSEILGQTYIDVHEQLGPNVDSILFTGEDFHSIALAKANLRISQAMHSVLSSNLEELQKVISRQLGKSGFGYRVSRSR